MPNGAKRRELPAERSVTSAAGVTWQGLPRDPLAVGADLGGRYLVQRLLGAGGGGSVFRAWDTQLGCAVAVKVLARQDAGGTRRFVREVCLARSVRHANVCPVYDLGRSAQHWFITMELATGSLRHELAAAVGDARPGIAPAWERRASDARALCAGLAAIHAAGITHGDLTPRNVLRMEDGRLAVSDFGMARRDGDETLGYGGTLSYISPEAMMGAPPDRRSDVWQLGIVLHEILLGARPAWRLTAHRPVADGADGAAPPAIQALLALAGACLAWDPDARPSSAAVVLERAARLTA